MKEKRFGPVLFLPGCNGGNHPCCNSIYIETHGILVDPACDRKRLARLREEENIRAVWLTHCHEDHIRDLDLFEDLPFYIAEADAPPLGDIDLFKEWDWYEVDGEERDWWAAMMLNDFHFRPRKPAGFLKEGAVTEQGVTVEVVPTPGHTAGSVSFYIREPGVLFTGDYDLTPFGPYYGDRSSSIEDTLTSIGRMKNVPARTVLTGHGNGLFEHPGDALWDNYAAKIGTRERKLLDLLEAPRTMEEIISTFIIYGKGLEKKPFVKIGERVLMKKHLERLIEKGTVGFDGDAYFLL
ncbi:MAG TPA: MBL fold metallo-hydrolase [Spirochaetes bacterium]|nr:MBL fold metallo-hydrolase [Spirochaetota bacterium]